jgi:hypothetical protein
LENLHNGFELLIRNQKVDQLDFKKQARDLEALKVYERIPFQPETQALKKSLIAHGKTAGFPVTGVTFLPSSLPPSRPHSMPQTLHIKGEFFHPAPEQFVQEVRFKFQVSGSRALIQRWTQTWKDDLMRLVELDSISESASVASLYEVQAHAFQFKKVKYPKIIPPHAVEYLPAWAQANPKVFSQQEPALWSWVTRSEKLRPLTPTLYEKRGEFLLEAAHLEFFLAHSMNKTSNKKS